MKTNSENSSSLCKNVPLCKQRRKRQKLLLEDLVLDYAKNSSLHGLHYIAEKRLTTYEKLFWIVTFTTSIILCSFLIKNVYVKWKTSPVIVTVSERLVSVGEIPFPSVTICPQIKSKATVYNLSQEFEKIKENLTQISKKDIAMFADVSIFCRLPIEGLGISNRSRTNSSFIDHMDFVAPELSNFLFSCSWHINVINNCEELFQKVYTAEGLCYNMNGLAASDMLRDTVQKEYKYSQRNLLTNGWSLDNGYSENSMDQFPLQGRENGASPDLEVNIVNNINDRDAFCNGINSGFKIYIQHPTDHPQSSLYYYAALDGQVSSMAITANIITSDPSLENYLPEIRQCYFQNDRQLRYFKIYTASNCQLECLSNYTYQECGCVGYYMPHDNSSEICAEGKLICMDKAHDSLAQKELQIKIKNGNGGCQCLAACNSVEYDADILKTDFRFKTYADAILAPAGTSLEEFFGNSSRYSRVEIYFKKAQFMSMRRSELFGLTDFLANIGGLLGVFLGFSFISLAELFYFITLRLGCTFRKDQEEERLRSQNSKLTNEKTGL